MNSSEPGSRAGSRFGPYRLMRLLGDGGLGEVYAAEDTRDGRLVAVKLISEQLSGDPALAALETGLIDGTDLATLLRSSGPLSPPRAVAIVRQVAAALDAAHDAGVTHRDVKPANILVTDDDQAYLKDFGTTAAVDPKPAAEEAHLADVYALAGVLTECLIGETPSPADSVEPAPPRPSQLRPGRIPAALDEVVARGLARKPEDRYRSAGDLAVASYQALTAPERSQVSRILRRGEAGPALVGTTEEATQPVPTVSPVPSAPPAATQRVWTPPDNDRGGLKSLPAGELSVGPARLLDFQPAPRRIPGVSLLGRVRRPILIAAAASVVVAAVVAAAHLVGRSSEQASAAAPRQIELAFGDLDYRLAPGGVAVDADGNVYVTSQGTSGQVLKLPAGSTTPEALPLSGLYQPRGVVVDSAGTLYFSDFNNRVVKVVAGSNAQTVLPFSGLDSPEGVAVDSGGNVYVADRGNNLVMKLDAGSNTQIVLPFSGLGNPDGVAVDSGGNVYVTDTGNDRVLKLSPGSNQQTVLPFTGIVSPWGIAVDDHGSVYVTERDSNKVVELADGALVPNVLPFVGLNTPLDVAVDNHGNVYVADRGNDRVVKVASD